MPAQPHRSARSPFTARLTYLALVGLACALGPASVALTSDGADVSAWWPAAGVAVLAVIAAIAGAGLIALMAGTAATLPADSGSWTTDFPVFASHGPATMTLVPVGIAGTRLRGAGQPWQRVAQPAVLAVVSLFVFWPGRHEPLAVLPMPFLVRGTSQFATRHVEIQLVEREQLLRGGIAGPARWSVCRSRRPTSTWRRRLCVPFRRPHPDAERHDTTRDGQCGSGRTGATGSMGAVQISPVDRCERLPSQDALRSACGECDLDDAAAADATARPTPGRQRS